mmetsp:Transcript_21069/g.48730  ORF Transcript_21069/g.48730 Transcript_21069/m.48730 type:complete len:382 (-) Transcript_21069:2561-3706(-)
MSVMASYQTQALEMKQHGIYVAFDATQVIFSGPDQTRVVRAVVDGEADYGLVRSDLLWMMQAQGVLNVSDLHVVNGVSGVSFEGKEFPYPVTGKIFPGWPFAALRHVDRAVVQKVAMGLLKMPSSHRAVVQGSYGGWLLPSTYTPVRNMLEHLSMIDGDTFTCKDLRSSYLRLDCPPKTYKLPERDASDGCAMAGIGCPESSECWCSPCRVGQQVQVLPTTLKKLHIGETAACVKMRPCGRAEQGSFQTFSVIDYGGHGHFNVTFKMHGGSEQEKVDGRCWEAGIRGWSCEFSVSSQRRGNHIIEIFNGEEQIVASPILFNVVSRNCSFAGLGRQANHIGDCVCGEGYVGLNWFCLSHMQVFILCVLLCMCAGAAYVGAIP